MQSGANHRIRSTKRIVGAQNFREVAGHRTRDGRRVRAGHVFRSARLDQLTDQDCARIVDLGIGVIADLRQPSERLRWPTHPRLLDQVRSLCWDAPDAANSRRHTLQDLAPVADDAARAVRALMQMYAQIPEIHAAHFGELFQTIADDHTPILIHCSAGKDRTGVAVALLLDLLGVERSLILDDYALSEQLLDWSRLDVAATLGIDTSASHRELPAVLLDRMLRSDPRYLQATFDHLEQRYGSTERFISMAGVSLSTVSQIRRRLLDELPRPPGCHFDSDRLGPDQYPDLSQASADSTSDLSISRQPRMAASCPAAQTATVDDGGPHV